MLFPTLSPDRADAGMPHPDAGVARRAKLTAQLFADFFAGALRLGEGGGSDGGAASAERFPTAADAVAAATGAAAVMVDFDSGIERESGAAVSAVAP